MEVLKDFSIIFVSIFFESFPFLLLGAFISSLIEVFISDETIVRIIPKNRILGTFVGIILGFFIPACDCAVIPISKRLIQKKVPLNVCISFMLASPIINPVVLASTYLAFYKTNPGIFYSRLILGILIAFVIGIIMDIIFHKSSVVVDKDCSCCHHHDSNKFFSIVNHTVLDLFDVLKYLIIGACIASLCQVLIPRNVLNFFDGNNIISILILMIFAYLISLCSTSDSFVGKSLLSCFSSSSIVSYLLLGPMIDIKNTIVLLGNFNKKFVIVLITLIFSFVFLFSMIYGSIL